MVQHVDFWLPRENNNFLRNSLEFYIFLFAYALA